MLFRMSILAIATCSLALTACSNKNEKKVVRKVDTNSIMADTSLTREDKAEKLALAAEQLVSPGSFMYAQEVVDQSLKIDKNNKRAQLVDALIAPMMTTKGILTRVKPLSEKTEEGKKHHEKTLADLEAQPTHAVKTFLLDGKADIKTEKDVQNYIDSVRNAFNKQRLFFKNNKDLEMTFNIADLFSAVELHKKDACYWVESEEGNYEEFCNEAEPAVYQYKLNRADNESFQQAAAGAQIYLSLLNAYNLSGSMDVALKNKDVMDSDDKLIREELLKNSSFGTLRTSAALSNIRSLGLDAVAGIRWASERQEELCAAGITDSSNRPGYVLSKGICMEDEDNGSGLNELLNTVELALNGTAQKLKFKSDIADDYSTKVNTTAVVTGSLKDVRSLGLQFNECNDVIGATDTTLAGTFPLQDANVVLNLKAKNCVTKQ